MAGDCLDRLPFSSFRPPNIALVILASHKDPRTRTVLLLQAIPFQRRIIYDRIVVQMLLRDTPPPPTFCVIMDGMNNVYERCETGEQQQGDTGRAKQRSHGRGKDRLWVVRGLQAKAGKIMQQRKEGEVFQLGLSDFVSFNRSLRIPKMLQTQSVRARACALDESCTRVAARKARGWTDRGGDQRMQGAAELDGKDG